MEESAADLASLATGGGKDDGVRPPRYRPFLRHRLPNNYSFALYGGGVGMGSKVPAARWQLFSDIFDIGFPEIAHHWETVHDWAVL